MASSNAINDILSVLLVGDSHVAGYADQMIPVEFKDRSIMALLKAVHITGAFGALDLVVTYPDGRTGVNPLLEKALRLWPGLDIKGNPLTPGTSVQKQAVLSIGTSFGALDPAMEFSDVHAEHLFFPSGIDFVLPERPDLSADPACQVMPVALIRDMYIGALAPTKTALSILAPLYPGRLWVLSAPPPTDHNAIRQKLVRQRAEQASSTPPTLAAPHVALKTWLLVSDIVKSFCSQIGCGFIPCSPGVQNETGFLRHEYEHDGFHANSAYNTAMAQHIVATLARSLAVPV